MKTHHTVMGHTAIVLVHHVSCSPWRFFTLSPFLEIPDNYLARKAAMLRPKFH